jgi:hypothetical protein
VLSRSVRLKGALDRPVVTEGLLKLPRFVSRSRVLLPPPPELRQRVVVLGRPRIKHLDRHLHCEWPLAATTVQAQQMRDLAVRKGIHHIVGLQARTAPAFNRVRDLVAEGYVGKVLSCTMIITTPAWGTEFTRDWAYMADRSSGNTQTAGGSLDTGALSLGSTRGPGGTSFQRCAAVRAHG